MAPEQLSAAHTESFAFATLHTRVPTIICQALDRLYRHRHRLCPSVSTQQLQSVLLGIIELRYELQSDCELRPLDDDLPDARVWNQHLEHMGLEDGGAAPTWLQSKWLYAECFGYRRLRSCVASCPPLRHLDYFAEQKHEAFFLSLPAIRVTAALLHSTLSAMAGTKGPLAEHKQAFLSLLQLCLWSNKCDLAISAGSQQQFPSDPALQVQLLRSNLLRDDSDDAWQVLVGASERHEQLVDLVMDNAGFEMFVDLCLADFLLSCRLATKVRLRVKNGPWFVSDTTADDLEWLLQRFLLAGQPGEPLGGGGAGGGDEGLLRELGSRWRQHLEQGRWTVHADPFWTYPHEYNLMQSCDPDLYSQLSQSSLVIFKGDLNYRKLVGDLKWHHTHPFAVALQDFRPAPILALRTLKADVVAGLSDEQVLRASHSDSHWMINGNWGLIQLAAADC